MLKAIPDFPGYIASSDGYIISKKHNKEKILKTYKKTHGYLYVAMSKNGKKHYVRLHRVIAKIFLPNPQGLREVNHLNEDKTDNRVSNLQWCTSRENKMYGTRCKKVAKKVSDPNIPRKNNTSGRKGVSVTKWGTYHAYMNGEGLGTYRTFEEAVAARERAEKRLL